jgi:CheY-like chemotaxis protein
MMNILIVDDSQFMRSYIKDMLTGNNECADILGDKIQCLEADGKLSALDKLAKSRIDIILLDIVMHESELEGIELIEAIHREFDVKRIVMVSSVRQQQLLDKCRKMGVTQYLQKPIEKAAMLAAIKDCMSCLADC